MNINELIEALANEQDADNPVLQELLGESAKQEDLEFATEIKLELAVSELNMVYDGCVIDYEQQVKEGRLGLVDPEYLLMVIRGAWAMRHD